VSGLRPVVLEANCFPEIGDEPHDSPGHDNVELAAIIGVWGELGGESPG